MFKNTDFNTQPVVCLGHYHPYRILGDKNPRFDNYSGSILNVKNFQNDDIQRFAKSIIALLNEDEAAICYVPSSNSTKSDTGVRRIAKLLCNVQKTDATGCLIRHTTIPKLATGGNRHIDVHLNSIRVEDTGLVQGKKVLLVDDVTTSHNSLFACKQLLIEAGASEVYCLALGQTD